ncbi:PE family protein, partial [Mycobacterium sp. Marseille-P9652]|uniref:PE family protein n=1 Tax=Mycobacterium sp. Marseille-P9652 TaxID=2654950 RepID=UPI0012E85605
MSFIVAMPEEFAPASSELTGLGLAVRQAHRAAVNATTQIVPAAGDEVSAAVSALFGNFAQEYYGLSAQGIRFHDQFVRALSGGGLAYAATEAESAPPLQALQQNILAAINAPAESLLGRPLIGNGMDGAPGSGQAGGPGGLLFGNGGRGGSGAPGQPGGPGGPAGLFGDGGPGGDGGAAVASGGTGGSGGAGGAGGFVGGNGGGGGGGGVGGPPRGGVGARGRGGGGGGGGRRGAGGGGRGGG